MTKRAAFGVVITAFVLAAVIGVYLVWLRGLPIVVLGLLGLVAGWTYTAPPFQWKYKSLGVPLVFLLMGPLMTCGAYFAVTGAWSAQSLVLSIPVGLLTAAILHGNEWRDISEDTWPASSPSSRSGASGRYALPRPRARGVHDPRRRRGAGLAAGHDRDRRPLAAVLARVICAAELGAGGRPGPSP
jgi:hypothetical protein